MFRSALLALTSAVLLAACNPQDEATKFCLSVDGTHQDCGIACTISKSDEACKKWETMTIELCDKVGKQQCQEICEADTNEFACSKAKSM
jgi:uncharacterized lipoprotein YehR (DUF1307 family)